MSLVVVEDARVRDTGGPRGEHVAAIVESAQEQSSGLQQINVAVNQMDQETQKNAAMVEEMTAASHTLATEVDALNRLLGQFELGQGADAYRGSLKAA